MNQPGTWVCKKHQKTTNGPGAWLVGKSSSLPTVDNTMIYHQVHPKALNLKTGNLLELGCNFPDLIWDWPH